MPSPSCYLHISRQDVWLQRGDQFWGKHQVIKQQPVVIALSPCIVAQHKLPQPVAAEQVGLARLHHGVGQLQPLVLQAVLDARTIPANKAGHAKTWLRCDEVPSGKQDGSCWNMVEVWWSIVLQTGWVMLKHGWGVMKYVSCKQGGSC